MHLEKIYLVIFITTFLISIIKFFKEPKLSSGAILILSIFGGYLEAKDMTDTGKKMDSISDSSNQTMELTKKGNGLTDENIKVSKKNLNLSDTIRSIDSNIQNITKTTLALSNKIDSFLFGGNSFPWVELNTPFSDGHDIVLEIWNYRKNEKSRFEYERYTNGKFPLHGLHIEIIDYQKKQDIYTGVQGAKQIYTSYYDVDEVATKKKLEVNIALRSDWGKYPLQKFDFVITALNGVFYERACFMSGGVAVSSAYWVINTVTNDTLLKPYLKQIEAFQTNGISMQEMLR